MDSGIVNKRRNQIRDDPDASEPCDEKKIVKFEPIDMDESFPSLGSGQDFYAQYSESGTD